MPAIQALAAAKLVSRKESKQEGRHCRKMAKFAQERVARPEVADCTELGSWRSRVNLVDKAECEIIGLRPQRGDARKEQKNTLIEWHLGSATALPFEDSTVAGWTARANHVMPRT